MYAPVFLPPVKAFLSAIGLLMICASLGLGHYAYTMDVSGFRDVVSFQLLTRQVCLALFSVGFFVGGVFMFGFGQVIKSQE